MSRLLNEETHNAIVACKNVEGQTGMPLLSPSPATYGSAVWNIINLWFISSHLPGNCSDEYASPGVHTG